MLTGYLGLQVNRYMLASDDHRYAEPGSLTFRLNAHTAYAHDAHTLARSVPANFERSYFCLCPCEPNWIYPVCNMYGLGSVAARDAVFGLHDAPRVLPRWMEHLEREFVDAKGSIVGLRSYVTGHALGIFNGEAGFAFFANVFSPTLARRLWAVGRRELGSCMAPDAGGTPRLAQARYPEVPVAKAVSDGDDLELVLFPGRGAGRRALAFDRLRPGRHYRVEGGTGASLVADESGCASCDVELAGRTALRLLPVA